MHVFVCIWGSNRYLMKVKFGLAMAAESGGKNGHYYRIANQSHSPEDGCVMERTKFIGGFFAIKYQKKKLE